MDMDTLMRTQLGNAQTAFARRQQGAPAAPSPASPQAQAAIAQAWALQGPGQMAPREQFNFEPVGGGAWRIYPPGRAAPRHAPQGSLPAMPPSFDELKRLGDDLDKSFGPGAPPPVPGPFPKAPPPRQKPPGGTSGLV